MSDARAPLSQLVDLDDEAEDDEVAAVVAAITRYIAEEEEEDGTEGFDAWKLSGRYATAVGREVRTPASLEGEDGWKLASRADRF